jgi:hypothetical protein
VESQPLVAPASLESADPEDGALDEKFDVHAWFEAYPQEPEDAELAGVPFH